MKAVALVSGSVDHLPPVPIPSKPPRRLARYGRLANATSKASSQLSVGVPDLIHDGLRPKRIEEEPPHRTPRSAYRDRLKSP